MPFSISSIDISFGKVFVDLFTTTIDSISASYYLSFYRQRFKFKSVACSTVSQKIVILMPRPAKVSLRQILDGSMVGAISSSKFALEIVSATSRPIDTCLVGLAGGSQWRVGQESFLAPQALWRYRTPTGKSPWRHSARRRCSRRWAGHVAKKMLR